jgi:hypothetical protein
MRPVVRGIAGALLASLVGCSGRTEHSGNAPPPPRAPVATVSAPDANPTRHLLMVVELEPVAQTARVLSARSVELPLPRHRGPERALPWRVEVLGGSGEVLFAAPLPDATELRAEFPDTSTGELRGVTTHKRVAAVTLRLPQLAAATQIRLVDVAHGGVELGRVTYPGLAGPTP